MRRGPDLRWRLNYICPYYTMFPITFPLRVLARARRGDWVLDPFCGRGTTLYAARLLGLPAVGIDSNPVAVAVAAAKLARASAGAIVERCREILAAPEVGVPDGVFWRRCFHPDTLAEIAKLRAALARPDATSGVDTVLRAILLGALHGPVTKSASYLSNQLPRSYATKPEAALRYWRQNHQWPRYVSVARCVERRAQRALEQVPRPVPGRVVCADSRDLDASYTRRKFSWIVTSPPYLGMRTYESDQWLRRWFVGGPPSVNYRSTNLLGTTDRTSFVHELAEVWERVARRAVPGAQLVVRFGALPSVGGSPLDTLRASIAEADAGWQVRTIRSAGAPAAARRQATQFGTASTAVDEIALYATLSA